MFLITSSQFAFEVPVDHCMTHCHARTRTSLLSKLHTERNKKQPVVASSPSFHLLIKDCDPCTIPGFLWYFLFASLLHTTVCLKKMQDSCISIPISNSLCPQLLSSNSLLLSNSDVLGSSRVSFYLSFLFSVYLVRSGSLFIPFQQSVCESVWVCQWQVSLPRGSG